MERRRGKLTGVIITKAHFNPCLSPNTNHSFLNYITQ